MVIEFYSKVLLMSQSHSMSPSPPPMPMFDALVSIEGVPRKSVQKTVSWGFDQLSKTHLIDDCCSSIKGKSVSQLPVPPSRSNRHHSPGKQV
jgi:hypothetical protein